MDLRIPFAKAIKDKRMLAGRWEMLSTPQKVALKSIYGLPLDESELKIWSAQQGGATYDNLGYITAITDVPYSQKKRNEAWMICGRRAGKGRPLDTIIPTPNGWTKIQDLKIGDKVFDEQGHPCNVTFISDIHIGLPCYRLTFSDGATAVADCEHKWSVWDKPQRKHGNPTLKTLTTEEIFKTGVKTYAEKESRYAIPVCGPLKYKQHDRRQDYYPVDPYVLGLWLGDGGSHHARIATADEEILDSLKALGWPNKHIGKYDYSLGGINVKGLRLQTCLRKMNLIRNKHIPDKYLFGHINQRIDLLQGLMDTDGTCDKNGACEFYSSSKRLIEQVHELLTGLGIKNLIRVKKEPKGTSYGESYRINFRAPFYVFRLSRKKERQKLHKKWSQPQLRYITDIEEVPSVPTICIAVDSKSHLYLADKACIPTHNTDHLASTIVAYEALFGGHEAYISRGQHAYCFQISQDLRNAAASLHFIYQTIEDSPVGREMLDGPPVKDEIRLKNKVIIKCIPCTLKAARGFAVPVAVLDEVGVWYTEADSANQDEEVYAAVKKSQIQFPNKLIVGISSPYIKSGLLYRFHEAGTDGKNTTSLDKRHFRNVVVIHAPTPAMGNPLVTKESLEEEYDRDPRAYERECLAIFQDSISGFLTPALIKEATDINVHERPPEPERYNYVAAIDPAFRHDAFAFVIFHLDEDGNVVQDAVRRYKPSPGKALNPKAVLADIAPLLRSYDIVVLYSDQYHLESLQQLVMEFGFLIEGVPFKATNKAIIYGSLQQLLNQHRLRLLDHGECLRELRMLEKKLSSGGIVQIHAPQGQYDDLASACALCCYKCLWMSPKPVEEPTKDKSTHELILEQIRRRKAGNDHASKWD